MSISAYGPGKWRIWIDKYKKGTTTRAGRKTEVFTGTKTEARRRERDLEAERDSGRLIDRHNQPLGKYLEWWFQEIEATLEISSFIACKNHLHRVWKTDLHEIPLAALLPEHIQEVLNHMEKVERVSYGTIKNFRDNLRNALNRAIELNRITVNPILVCKLPKERRRKKVIWTRPQLDGFLEYIRDDGYHYSDAFELILFTGLRRAEICGLHWSMVNFEEHYLDMNRTRHSMPKLGPDRPGGGWYEKAPKSEMGLRYLEISPRCVALLRRVQATQAHFQLGAPGIWPADPFVICRPDGTVTRPDKMGRYFRKLLDRYNAGVDEKDQLPMVTPHDLRRHHASYLAELGYTTSAIAARLGHASTTITDRVYIRNRPGAFSDYVERLDEFLDGPVDDGPSDL